jgi:hypothetical protein
MNSKNKIKYSPVVKTRPASAPKKQASASAADVFSQALGYADSAAVWL